MKLETKQWIKASFTRAVKTMAQTGVALISASSFLHEVDWKLTVSATALAGILSILTSIAGLPELK